jgi:hypothetical protein
MSKTISTLFTLAVVLATSATQASVYQWTDWQSSNYGSSLPFVAEGQITTTSTTVDVTYTNAQGVSFFQDGINGNSTDYYANGSYGINGRNDAVSPYTSPELGTNGVDNAPPAAEMIALNQAGYQTLTFSQAIANPVFAFVSLNGNGYAFDQDFEILSEAGVGGNDSGYWGSGTSTKSTVDLGGGNFEYQLLGSGEPHGTIRFLGTFSSVTWRSLTSENWNGFTVGIQGTADEVFVPEPAAVAVWSFLGLSAAGMTYIRRLRANRA